MGIGQSEMNVFNTNTLIWQKISKVLKIPITNTILKVLKIPIVLNTHTLLFTSLSTHLSVLLLIIHCKMYVFYKKMMSESCKGIISIICNSLTNPIWCEGSCKKKCKLSFPDQWVLIINSKAFFIKEFEHVSYSLSSETMLLKYTKLL